MNYTEFKNKFQGLPVILSREVEKQGKDRQVVRNQLNRWQDKELIIKLKRGMYLLNENDRKINPSRSFIANQLFWPSYVSLEYALGFYGLIPEKAVDVTSVTTKKTYCLENGFGRFVYQHIKPSGFRGFRSVKEEGGISFFIAEPEKAVVDFLYLNLRKFARSSGDVFRDSYRFQNLGILRKRRIIELARLFGNNGLTKAVREFCDFIKEEN
ncbi:MAG: hypothetical protein AB1498_00280 [bacterium]